MENSSKRVRVRFAPSPTGPLHMGGVRTALYNYLFAKQHHGDFILRIEDTDQTRFVPGAEEYIVEALQWCGIQFDEGVHVGGPYGPYRQSERKPMYLEYAERLIASGHAYYAFDTQEELEDMRKRMTDAGAVAPQYNAVIRGSMKNSLSLSADEVQKRLNGRDAYVIRIKMPRNEEVRVNDLIRGWVVVNTAQLDDKVLFKSDGMPTYHLANVVDDYLMKITHVIRGEEWLPSAPLHVLLYRYLGWEEVMPAFAHLPLLLRPDGNGKLSKRDGDRLGFPVFPLDWLDPHSGERSSGYRERGYFPEAFINMLALLGWNPGTTQELFSLEELINAFSIERVGKSGARFDPEKAKWFNQQVLRQKDDKELAEIFQKALQIHGISVSSDYVEKVCSLIKEKAQFTNEFWEIGKYFFTAPESYDEAIIRKKWNEDAKKFISELIIHYKNLKIFLPSEAERVFKEVAGNLGQNPGSFMQLFRVLISGQAAGPALFDAVSLIGKEETIVRLEKAVGRLSD